MIKIADIYISNTGYLLQLIEFQNYKKNRQHYILDNPDYSNISIDNYKRVKFPTFMFALFVFVTI